MLPSQRKPGKRVRLTRDKLRISPVDSDRTGDGIRSHYHIIAEINRSRITNVAAIVVIVQIVRRKSPIPDTIGWKQIVSERINFAFERNRTAYHSRDFASLKEANLPAACGAKNDFDIR